MHKTGFWVNSSCPRLSHTSESHTQPRLMACSLSRAGKALDRCWRGCSQQWRRWRQRRPVSQSRMQHQTACPSAPAMGSTRAHPERAPPARNRVFSPDLTLHGVVACMRCISGLSRHGLEVYAWSCFDEHVPGTSLVCLKYYKKCTRGSADQMLQGKRKPARAAKRTHRVTPCPGQQYERDASAVR